MEPAHTDDVAGRWARFAANETPRHSAVMQAWAAGVSEDPEVCGLIGRLTPRERQPNLVLAAARVVDPTLVEPDRREARPDEYHRLRAVLVERWDEVAALTARRHTQTNEPARLAVVMPLLAELAERSGRELALVEVGASAGLTLHPGAWRFRYVDRAGPDLSSFGPEQAPELVVTVKSSEVTVPRCLPPIGWRIGLDLQPLDPARADDAEWLRTLVWPGQTHRLERLDHAIDAARRDPVLVLRRDLTAPGVVDEVLRLIPPEFLPVVVHGAVLAYVDEDARRAFGERVLAGVRAGELHWISNEGAGVLPQVHAELARRPAFSASLRKGAFVVALDGVPRYQADGHGGWVL